MAFSEICRICLSVNVRMIVLKMTGLQNLYKTLTNSSIDEDEEPIIVCFICHARLNRCRRLQQQAIESNAVLEQLLAGVSTSILKPLEVRDEIQFTPINLIDIRPVECDIENDCKDEIFNLDSVKVEEENFENEYLEFEENGIHETEQYITPTNNFSEPSEEKFQPNSTDCNINDVRKENLNFESLTGKSNSTVIKDNQPITKNEKHPVKCYPPAKIMRKKILKQNSVNVLTKETSEASTKYIFECDVSSKRFSTKNNLAKHFSYSHEAQKSSDTTVVRTCVEQTPEPQLTEIFNCDICKFKTSIKRYILAHCKAHVAKQVYSCDYCDYISIKNCDLQKHMRIHTGEKPFSCHICEYRCATQSCLQTHIKVHEGEKAFSCDIYQYKFVQKSNLRRDITTLTEPSEEKIKSNSTDSNLNDVRKENLDFKRPIRSNPKAKKGTQPFNTKGNHSAKITKKKVLKQKSVNTLTQRTSGTSTKYRFECDNCNKIFSTKDILAKHISYSHMTQKNSDITAVWTRDERTAVPQLTEVFNCYYCEFKTSQKRCICAHLRAHSAKQLYCCINCDYKCTKRINLQHHMKIHTGEKPFSCNICDYKCITKSNLRTHMKIHTGEKPFSCNICEYKSIEKIQLQRHMKKHTGEKPFSCNICEYKCIMKGNLRTHMKIHTGEKPFSCNICEYKCIHKSRLQMHMKIHTGEKSFS